jgi:hypothetical protein
MSVDSMQSVDYRVLDVPMMIALLLVEGLVIALFAGVCLLRSSRRERVDPRAEERARGLLQELLTDEELLQLAGSGYLEIHSPSSPSRVYRIPTLAGEMVAVHESGRMIEKLCVEPAEEWLPPSDLVLMHKLMIEGNENVYLREANVFTEESSFPQPRRQGGDR